MKLIIAGSRTIDKYQAFYLWYEWCNAAPGRHLDITEFVTGVCPSGPDQVPYLEHQAKEHLLGDPYYSPVLIKEFPADWNTHGRAAGPIRNREMAQYADALLLIWDGNSSGSANMKREMQKLNKPVHEIIV